MEELLNLFTDENIIALELDSEATNELADIRVYAQHMYFCAKNINSSNSAYNKNKMNKSRTKILSYYNQFDHTFVLWPTLVSFKRICF
jgi:hypothetical protein